MRLGMSKSGMPLRFSEKITAPLAASCSRPAERKNASATSGS